MCTCVLILQEARSIRAPGDAVTGGCEMPEMDAGDGMRSPACTLNHCAVSRISQNHRF